MLFENIIFSNFKNKKIVFCFLVVKHIIPFFFPREHKIVFEIKQLHYQTNPKTHNWNQRNTIACGATTNE